MMIFDKFEIEPTILGRLELIRFVTLRLMIKSI